MNGFLMFPCGERCDGRYGVWVDDVGTLGDFNIMTLKELVDANNPFCGDVGNTVARRLDPFGSHCVAWKLSGIARGADAELLARLLRQPEHSRLSRRAAVVQLLHQDAGVSWNGPCLLNG